jgi:hypothetical protein
VYYLTLVVAFFAPAFGSYISWRLHRIAGNVAQVSEKLSDVHSLVNGQHEALQALADERGVTIGKQDVTIQRMTDEANGS